MRMCVMCMCDKYETDDEESEVEYKPECKCVSLLIAKQEIGGSFRALPASSRTRSKYL